LLFWAPYIDASSSARNSRRYVFRRSKPSVLDPMRIATCCKPAARSKTQTAGWQWASVNVIAFRKGKARDPEPAELLDYIIAAPVTRGRRAELPPVVADWLVAPFAIENGLLLDPFAGSGAILAAAERHNMRALDYEKSQM
jgi:hypothetical protein